MKKKIALALCAAIILAAMVPAAVYAHGGHGGRHHANRRVNERVAPRIAPRPGGGRVNANVAPRFEICPVEDCEIYGPHEHDGTWYHCAYYPHGGGFCGGGACYRR